MNINKTHIDIYIDMRDPTQLDEFIIEPCEILYNEHDRVRIYSTQLQDEVLNNISKSNYQYHCGLYLKLGYNLTQLFPKSSNKINNSILNFWERVQIKLKKLSS